MRFNKIVKALAVSLPILAISACSSTDSSEEEAARQAAEAKAAAEAQAAEQAEQVRIAKMKKEQALAEEKRQMEQLLAENIIYFEFDKSTLSSEFSAILDAHAKFLNANPSKSVLVEGHADERGTPEYNIALGERRAKAVVSYLENMGVASSQISTVSYGEEKPMNKARTEAAFAANRRAVLVY